MDKDILEFRAWMKLNRKHFLEGNYSREEVTELAILAGFDRLLIYKELSHFQDALLGTNFDNRAQFQITHELWTVEMLAGKIDLREQWKALYNKIERGLDYDDYTL